MVCLTEQSVFKKYRRKKKSLTGATWAASTLQPFDLFYMYQGSYMDVFVICANHSQTLFAAKTIPI